MRKAANASPYLRDQEAIGEFLANHSDAILELVRAAAEVAALGKQQEKPMNVGQIYEHGIETLHANIKLRSALAKLNGEQR